MPSASAATEGGSRRSRGAATDGGGASSWHGAASGAGLAGGREAACKRRDASGTGAARRPPKLVGPKTQERSDRRAPCPATERPVPGA